MRKITKEYTIYNYTELSKKAKKKCREIFEEMRIDDKEAFEDCCMEELSELFPNSDLKIEYSLGYCQGDGLNIYGDLDLSDMLENLLEKFTKKEVRFLKWAFDNGYYACSLYQNSRYSYCISDKYHYTDETMFSLEDQEFSGIKYDVLEKFDKLAGKFLSDLCGKFEKDGYTWFYEFSEEEVSEYFMENDYEFYEDGRIYYE